MQHCFAGLRLVNPFDHHGRKSQEAQHQCLGLNQHAKHIDWQCPAPFPPDSQISHQHQSEAQYSVHLAPCGTIQDKCRIQGKGQSQPCRLITRATLFPSNTISHIGHTKITKAGDDFENHCRPKQIGKRGMTGSQVADEAGNAAVQSKDVHIGWRIIAEVCRLIKLCRSDLRHGAAPAKEAVHIHRIAIHQHSNNHANRKGQHQADTKPQRHVLLFLQIMPVKGQGRRKPHHEKQEGHAHGNQPRPERRSG